MLIQSYAVMKTRLLIACLIIYGFHNSVEAQSPLPLKSNPTKSEITLYSDSDNMIGALFLLKDSSILVSSSLVKLDYNIGNYEVAELYIDDINLISTERQGGTLHGALLGGAIGVTTGVVIGLISGDDSSIFGFTAEQKAIIGGVGLGAIGALTGAIIGSIKIKIPINGSMENYNLQKKKLGRNTINYPGSPTY